MSTPCIRIDYELYWEGHVDETAMDQLMPKRAPNYIYDQGESQKAVKQLAQHLSSTPANDEPGLLSKGGSYLLGVAKSLVGQYGPTIARNLSIRGVGA